MIAEPLDPRRDSYPDGPTRLAVLGPPGTGKTQTICDLMLVPALTSGVPPHRVVAASFSRSAARELARRLWPLVRPHVHPVALDACTSTLHSLALGLLREVRSPAELTVIGGTRLEWRPSSARTGAPSEPESRLRDQRDDQGKDEVERMSSLWDLARNLQIVDPLGAQFATLARRQVADLPLGRIRSAIAGYEDAKRSHGAIDYCDMLQRALDTPPHDLELLVIDEAQDCSPLQWALIDHLSSRAAHVVLVGDVDQTIFGFGGAEPRELLRRLRSGTWAVRRLVQSHRVPAPVHSIASALIGCNRDRIDAPYMPAQHAGLVRVAEPPDVVAQIGLADQKGHEVLVLTRRGRDLDRWSGLLSAAATPHLHERGACPLGHPQEVRRVRAALALRDGAAISRGDLAAILKGVEGAFLLGDRETLVERARLAADPITRDACQDLGLRVVELAALDTRDLTRALRVHRIRGDGLARLVARHGRVVLDPPPRMLARRPDDADELPAVRVRLTTWHGSKGREAPLVVVDLRMPRLARLAADVSREALEAERRLLYVAVTRARQRLLLVRPGRYDAGQLLGLSLHSSRSMSS